MNLHSIKQRLYKNELIFAFSCFLKGKLDKNSRKVRHFTKRISKIDSINNYDLFKTEMSEMLKNNLKWIDFIHYQQISHYYGYYNELLAYSSMNNSIFRLIGDIEHGINFTGDKLKYNNHTIYYISQGDYRRNDIRSHDELCPFFSVGPYIHYARQYYSENQIKEIKKKNGRTLLIIPSHSIEGDKYRSSDKKDYVDLLFNHNYGTFDTIYVCVYWNDIYAEDIERFKEKGAKIVSAGFRGDKNFIRRLKTIISISDCVVTNDIGTNVGFCLALNKKVIITNDVNRRKTQIPFFEKKYTEFLSAFSSKDGSFSDNQIKKQTEMFNYYWGGNNNLKTKEQIKAFFTLMNKINKLSHYSVKNRENIIKKMLTDQNHLTKLEHQMLLEIIR